MAVNFTSSGRRSRGNLAPLASINVTSLLDITMVLLISFMIIAPTLQSGIAVDLPEVVESSALDSKDNPLVLSVGKGASGSGIRLMLNDESLEVGELRDRLMAEKSRRREVVLVIKGDKSVPWQEMAQVLGAVQASGIAGMSLVTMPTEAPPSE